MVSVLNITSKESRYFVCLRIVNILFEHILRFIITVIYSYIIKKIVSNISLEISQPLLSCHIFTVVRMSVRKGVETKCFWFCCHISFQRGEFSNEELYLCIMKSV